MASTKRNELIHRLLAGRCELCGSTARLEVHHLRKLADLNRHDRPDKPAWVHLMAKRRRKTLVICRICHEVIHAGRASAPARNWPLESRVTGNRPARFGKGPTEKDPPHGHLVGGLLHSEGDRAEKDQPSRHLVARSTLREARTYDLDRDLAGLQDASAGGMARFRDPRHR
jgi:AI2M/AI1M-like HNH endonuclease